VANTNHGTPEPSPEPPFEQPSIPSVPITPIMDYPPPLAPQDSDAIDLDDDEDEDGNEVSVNPRHHPSLTTRSCKRVRPPCRNNLNYIKVKELNAMKTNNDHELRKKLSSQKLRARVMNHQLISSVKLTQLKSCALTGKLGKLHGNLHQETDHELCTLDHLYKSAFTAKANSEDTPNYEETMNGPLSDDFRKAMEVEWYMLNVVMKAWEIVERQQWMNVLPSTWALICKMFPDGLVRKLKAILYA
jgi:hypothetical protein